MNKLLATITSVILLACTSLGQAQIPAPDFVCIENDSLYWNVPVVTCGPILGYEIYFSEMPTGPYSLLTTISDPNQTDYAFINPGSLVQYFYMTTLADCPGQTAESSDTLNNRNPMESPIDFLTVNGSFVEINWTYSTEPDVVGYIIYKATSSGSIPIDTVTVSPYLDITAIANDQVELYFVNALDACGNASFFHLPHNTMLLEGRDNNCAQTIDLSWNAYENWPMGVANYEIYASINGGQEQLINSIPGDNPSFSIPNVKSDSLYTVRIAAVSMGDGFRSFSNTIDVTPQVTEKLDPFVLFNVHVISDNQVVLEWYYEGDLQANTVFATHACATNDVAIVTQLNGIAGRGQVQRDTISGIDITCINRFTVLANNPCDSTFQSNPLSNIVLSGEQGETNTSLDWNPLDVNLVRQQVIRNETEQVYVTTNGSTNTTQLSSSIDDPSACYQVIDSASIILPDGTIYGYVAHSNIVCVFPTLNVYIPTAFAPEGFVNTQFRPYYNNVSLITDYDLRIFDRFGGILFQTKDPLHVWNGQVRDKFVDPGLYTYALRITSINEEVILRKGGVTVLR